MGVGWFHSFLLRVLQNLLTENERRLTPTFVFSVQYLINKKKNMEKNRTFKDLLVQIGIDEQKNGVIMTSSEDPIPEALFVLYGEHDRGKTTTLTTLVLMLAGKSLTNRVIKKMKKKTQKANGGFRDGYYIIRYCGKWIFISTCGDTRKECEKNINFFHGVAVHRDIHIVYNNEIYTLRKGNPNKHIRPDICITASRVKGESVQPILYLANRLFCNCHWQIWRQKIGYEKMTDVIYSNPSCSITKDDDDVANELKQLLDEYVLKKKTPTIIIQKN